MAKKQNQTNEEEVQSFEATVLEVTENYLIVEPVEGSSERRIDIFDSLILLLSSEQVLNISKIY